MLNIYKLFYKFILITEIILYLNNFLVYKIISNFISIVTSLS